MSKSPVVVLILILSLIVTACSTKTENNRSSSQNQGTSQSTAPSQMAAATPQASEKPKELKEITMQATDPGPSLVNLPIYIAIDQGYFEKRGLKVKMIATKPSIAVQALMGGGLDYSSVFGSVVNAAVKGKAETIGLMPLIKKPMMVLMARPEIKTAKDLEGKTIAVTDITDAVGHMTRIFMKKENLDLSKVQLVAMPDPLARIAAAERGQVHAYYSAIPDFFKDETMGMHKITNLGSNAPVPITGLATTMKKVKENPEEVQKVVDSLLEALVFIKKNPDQMPKIIEKIMKLSPEDAKKAFNEVGDSYSVDGIATKEDLMLLTDLFNNYEKFPAETYDKVVDWSFVKKSQVAK